MTSRGAFITEAIEEGSVIPVFTGTKGIFVDMMTKAHGAADLERNRTDACLI
jgi:hypothetical protein